MPATGLFLRDGTRVRNPASLSRDADTKDQGILELWAGTAIIYGTPANVRCNHSFIRCVVLRF
jgi:hypothetical protein